MTEKSEALSLQPPSPTPPTKLGKRFKHLLEYAGLRLTMSAIRMLPRPQALQAGRLIGRATDRLLASRHSIAMKNLQTSLPDISPEQAEVLIGKCWENLGAGVAEFVKMPGFSREEVLSFSDVEGAEHLERSYKAGKGALIVTAHYGAWELGAKIWPFLGFRTAVVARRIKNPWVNDLVTRIRSCQGVQVILARDAVRESIRWLKKGGLLAVLIDHRVTEGGLKLPFLGKPAFTTALPAILALRYGVPAHPVHCWRSGERVRVHIAPALELGGLSPNDEGIAEATRRMNAVVEAWVRERPEAWLWIHNRWKGAS